jgi:hypothetical protein
MLGLKIVSALSLLLLASAAAVGCAATDEGATGSDNGASEDELRQGPNSARWVYNGKLPHLENPSIVVGQTTHTVRITGFLPADYDQNDLPFYTADTATPVDGRTRIDVVYPIATGASVNHQPNNYLTERVFPRRTDSSAPWGGFPFISYVNDISPMQGIAFHGPITADEGEWKLIRGPVSHGCNRMQGEHVVELAHLIGVDMTTKVWSGDTILRNLKVPVKVIRGSADQWNGQNVDIDYPAAASVRRPTENVKMFKAWRSEDFPAWVCRINDRNPPNLNAIPADYCTSALGLQNRTDGSSAPR